MAQRILPRPMGHYSQGGLAHGILCVSGQLPFDPMDRSLPEGVAAHAHLPKGRARFAYKRASEPRAGSGTAIGQGAQAGKGRGAASCGLSVGKE